MKIDLDKKERLADPEAVPQGKNNLSSRASFMQEKIYHQNAYKPIVDKIYVEPNNFYYDNLLYGRIDNLENSVIPISQKIKQVKNIKDIVYNLDFAVDAFEDFLGVWNLQKAKNIISDEGIFYEINKISGFSNPIIKYTNFMERQYDYYINFLEENNLIKNIKNITDFLKYFIRYSDFKTSIVPMTFSSFCVSKFTDLKINGLIFELSDDDIVDDNKKYEKFIKDANYPLFYNLANHHGFSIDKKVPWRLIANIDSIQMKKYLEKYNTKQEDIYRTHFSKTWNLDLELLIDLCNMFYEKFIEKNNKIIKPEIYLTKNNQFKVRNKIEKRSEKTSTNLSYEWFRFYIFLKARENNLDWDQPVFDDVVEKAYALLLGLDKDAAMRYIHKSVNLKVDSNKRNMFFSY